MTPVRCRVGPLLLCMCMAAGPSRPHLVWDRSTLNLIQRGGGYGRLARVRRSILCCFEWGRRACVRRSGDEGRTWAPPVQAADYPPGGAANPELLACRSGRLLLFYNGRPRDGRAAFTIGVVASTDGGATWSPPAPPLYAAGTRFGDGCYEPAAVQLPSGQVQLFFANEHGHASDGTQAIDRAASDDDGRTWSPPVAVSYRPGGRDGMPVPLLAGDGRSVLLAIEDNGLPGGRQLRPAVERLAITNGGTVGGHDDRRWAAVVDPPWPPAAYAGAPYLRQFPDGGPTVLACQPDVGHPGVQRMTVYIGGSTAQGFRTPTEPFPTDAGRPAQWNSLFVKGATTVTAVSTTTIGGVLGVWAIDGHLLDR